jgi:hypothetical protein
MSARTTLIAATILAASVSGAFAQTYNISITGACDKDTITVSNGFVYGQSTVANCDNSNLVGLRANTKVGVGGRVLVAGGDFGLAPEAWTWAFDIKTKTATLVGTSNGTSYLTDNFSFTYTKGDAKVDPKSNGLPSARSLAIARHH